MFETEDDQQVRNALIEAGWQCDSDGDLKLNTPRTVYRLWNPNPAHDEPRIDQKGVWEMWGPGDGIMRFPTLRAAYTAWLLGVTP